MKRAITVVGGLFGLLSLGLSVWIALNWAVLSAFPGMASAYEAKEYCSCRFVSLRDDDFCAAYVKQHTVPTQGRSVDEAARSVTARALWVSHTARWVDRRQGCVLDH